MSSSKSDQEPLSSRSFRVSEEEFVAESFRTMRTTQIFILKDDPRQGRDATVSRGDWLFRTRPGEGGTCTLFRGPCNPAATI